MELVKVVNDNGVNLVSARDLHEFLEVGRRFNDWIRNRIEKYGFEENQDFTAITQKKVTAQGNESEYTDYILKIDMAKELSMVENNDKGRQARKYFIECEKKLVEQVKVDSYMIADPVERAKAWIIEQEERIALAIENTEIKQAVVGIKNSLNNLEADVRVNINQAIRRLADVYCKHNKISGMDRECIYREIYQTIYTGFCKEYNIDFKDIKNKEYVSLKTGKPTKTKQSFIKIIESMGYSTMLMEYVIQLKPAEINLIKE